MTFQEALDAIFSTPKYTAVYTSKSGIEVRLKCVKARLEQQKVVVMSVDGKGWENFPSVAQHFVSGREYTERLLITKNMLQGEWQLKKAKSKAGKR